MRFIPISMARPGMYLAADLFDYQGRTVIGKGCMLTENYINGLIEYGFGGVYISDAISDGIELDSAISPQLRQAGVESVRKADVEKCSVIAKEIVREILPQERVSLDMADLRSFDDYVFAHSVNVAVLSCVLGIGFGMNETELEQLTLAALLHDLGKLSISQDILNNPTALSKQEYDVVKTHSVKSYEMLTDRYDISSKVRQTILFHHENEDGSGYPNGVTGDDLSLMVKILHVIDVYDALTSKRPYREAYSPSDAAEYLMGACGIMFDRAVVEKFLQLVPLYPKGTEIYLSDGTSGIVLENTGVNNLRPVVRLMGDMIKVDLADRNNLNLTIGTKAGFRVKDSSNNTVGGNAIMSNAPKKIMAVDDMATNLQMLKEILEDKYELILMKSGANAINYLSKIGEVDLILMDIDMPEMDGVEAARKIMELTNRTIPILFVSALCDRDTVLMCKELKVAGYVVRPYNSVYIKAEIEKVLSGAGGY